MKIDSFRISLSLGGIIAIALVFYVYLSARAELFDAKSRLCAVSPDSTFCKMYPNTKEG